MIRLLSLAFFLLQAILVFSLIIWGAAKLGFAVAQPYAAQIEAFFLPVWHAIISQF